MKISFSQLVFVCICLMLSINTSAQKKNKKSKNEKMKGADFISISIDTESGDMQDVPTSSKRMLATKLQQAVTKGGLTSEGTASRFYLSTDVAIIDQSRTPTAPPMVALSVELYLTIGDSETGDQYATESFELKGAGSSSQKAYTDTFKKLKSTNEKLVSFIEKGREKIVNVYDKQCDETMRQADLYASQDEYTKAIALLSTVPVFAKSCYKKASDKIETYYIKDQDQNCEKYLALAETAISLRSYEEAAQLLTSIDPATSCHKKADKLRNQIKKVSEDLYKEAQDRADRAERNKMKLARAKYASNMNYLSEDSNSDEASLFNILLPVTDEFGSVDLSSDKTTILIMGILDQPELAGKLFIDDQEISWMTDGRFSKEIEIAADEIEIRLVTKEGESNSKYIELNKTE